MEKRTVPVGMVPSASCAPGAQCRPVRVRTPCRMSSRNPTSVGSIPSTVVETMLTARSASEGP
jgi:hypothetical protein